MNEDSSNSLPNAGRLEQVVLPGRIWTDGSVEESSKITQRIQDWRKTLEDIAPSSPTADNIRRLRLAFVEHLQRIRVPADELTVEDINAEAEFARWLYPLIRSVGRRLGFSALECKTLLSEGAAERGSLWDDLREQAAEHAAQHAQSVGEAAAEGNRPVPPKTADLRTGARVEHLEPRKVFLQSEDPAVREVWNRLQQTPKEAQNISQICREVAEKLKDSDGRTAEVIRSTFNRWRKKNATGN